MAGVVDYVGCPPLLRFQALSPKGTSALLYILLAIGDFNCSIYLGIQAYLYTRLINLGFINNKIFNKINIL